MAREPSPRSTKVAPGALVSVIIPTHNRAGLLPDAIGSALAQTYPSLEVLVLDDGSMDDTWRVATAMAASEPRIRVHRHENMGQAATVNRGLELAAGEIAIMLSDDDLLCPDAVSRAAEALAAHPEAVMAFGDLELVDLAGRVIRLHRASPTTVDMILGDHEHSIGVGAAFRLAAARRAGGWDPRFRHVPDLDFWMRLGLLGPFVYVPELFGQWRIHEGQITEHRTDPECAAEHVAVVEQFLARQDLPASLAALAPRARASAHLVAATVLDPELCEADRRFYVLDRHALARANGGRTEDTTAYLLRTAEERLDVIKRLDHTAKERLELIHRLDSALAERAKTARLQDKRGLRRWFRG
jgi:hypothetical protein